MANQSRFSRVLVFCCFLSRGFCRSPLCFRSSLSSGLLLRSFDPRFCLGGISSYAPWRLENALFDWIGSGETSRLDGVRRYSCVIEELRA